MQCHASYICIYEYTTTQKFEIIYSMNRMFEFFKHQMHMPMIYADINWI